MTILSDGLSTPNLSATEQCINDDIVGALLAQNFLVVPRFLSLDEVKAIRAECLLLWRDGSFKQARVGHGVQQQRREDLRNDFIFWLDETSGLPAVERYFNRLESLRQTINRRLLLGLFEFEGHFAVYPPGHFYRAHVDQFADSRSRQISTVLYLNEDWSPQDGGQLRLYRHNQDPASVLDVYPAAGTLVVFFSEQLWHEVLPAQRERLSLTGWFRTRGN